MSHPNLDVAALRERDTEGQGGLEMLGLEENLVWCMGNALDLFQRVQIFAQSFLFLEILFPPL